ncbi:MAG TPA: O-antigen translocase [Clostridia bacterium]|nr:O-antigen translocase [Clostridia bacterium]
MNKPTNTYGQVLKSSALIGGSSLMNIGIGIIRTKALALLLGPAGVGLLGVFNSIADLARSIGTIGISSSGVRQVAEAAGSGDTLKLARTVKTLRWLSVVLGAAGALLLLALAYPVSLFSFQDAGYTGSVALLALAVFCGSVTAGQTALIQGVRRIRDLALNSVLGALYGTIASILIIYFFRRSGVVPSIVCVALAGVATSWWYSRKIHVESVRVGFRGLSAEVGALLKFGVVFMASGVMTMAVGYLVRIIVIRCLDEESAGYYQAAWALGGLYVGFILQAMGADFFPRLTSAAKDNRECNRLVNEQAEVSLLLAGPGLLATLTFAPYVIQVFYSSKFGPAVEVLRWICLGMILRIVTWPMGFILVAKGSRAPFFWSELFTSAVQILLAWVCVRAFGLKGTGIAFFCGYLFYWGLIYCIVRSVSGFRWSPINFKLGTIYGSLVLVYFVSWYWLPSPVMLAGGTLGTLLVGYFSSRRVCSLVPLDRFPGFARRLILFLRLAARPSQA